MEPSWVVLFYQNERFIHPVWMGRLVRRMANIGLFYPITAFFSETAIAIAELILHIGYMLIKWMNNG